MNIWIPGARGMLGSQVERLLKNGRANVLGAQAERIDIADLKAVKRFVSANHVTHIINCAAYTQVDKAETEKDKAFQANATGPENLGLAAKEHGVKVIHFSTDYVFDGTSSIPYEESNLCDPLNVYGASKWEGEKKLLEHAPDACVIRTSWLFGLNGKNFVETMIKLMKEKESLRIVSDQIGCPTFCQDLAETALRMWDQSGIFHFANAGQTSWYHFATEIHHAALSMGYHFQVKTLTPITTPEYPTPAKRPAFSLLSTQKVEKALNFKPRAWQEAVRDYLRQYQQQQHA